MEKETSKHGTQSEEKKPAGKIGRLLGFKLEIFSFDQLVKLMYRPCDCASLGVGRMLFGILMLLDISEERGGSELDLRWGEPRECRFPLIHWLKPLPLPQMGLLYGLMYLGALGITLGYRFRLSTVLFVIPYWYIFLLEKSVWNNHSYLYGLIAILMVGTCADNYCSVKKDKGSQTAPYWNYFILKYQFFILYFVAGLKKLSMEWLSGHAMTHISHHWVFAPFRLFLSPELTDLLIVHWFGCFFDLTAAFWLIFETTRAPAMLFATAFHLMNSRLFSIGMFPWVCLAELPLFCRKDWPRKFVKKLMFRADRNQDKLNKGSRKFRGQCDSSEAIPIKVTWKQRLVVGLLLAHCGVQAFLPYSHFITKGYNNWTDGLYGYSWDMMVHAWDTVLVSVRVVENDSKISHFLDPSAWIENDRWTKHGDMAYQYAHCLKNNLLEDYNLAKTKRKTSNMALTTNNISIYIDVWCSLNGRFQQRMFDPTVDMLTVNWSPFERVSWLLPLLHQFTDYRSKMADIQNEVHSWGNHSEVLFVSDFPGLFLENYISPDLYNVTVTVLNGKIKYEDDNGEFSSLLTERQHTAVKPNGFHKIHTIGPNPACYMYTYINKTREEIGYNSNVEMEVSRPKFETILDDILTRLENILKFYEHVGNSFLFVFYDVPMPRRVKIY